MTQHDMMWSGHFELKNAKWELDTGRTVEFRIVYYSDEPVKHPFREYQRQRGGKVGQRFHAVIVPDGFEVAAYASEVMLCAWADNQGGRTVKFWLDHEAEHHPFAGYKKYSGKEVGSMFSAALRVLEDCPDTPKEEQPKRRKFSQDAFLIITSEKYRQYLKERSGLTAVLEKRGLSWTPEFAKQYIKKKLNIESLSDLDRDPKKADLFHKLVRKPFLEWQEV